MKKENKQFVYEQGENGITILSVKGEEEELAIPEMIDDCAVTAVADGVFEELGAWVEVLRIPASLQKIGTPHSLGNTKLMIDEKNPYYYTDGYALYERQGGGTALVAVYLPDERERYAVKDGTVQIGEYAFYAQQHIQEIILPGSVERIRDAAFFMCGNLRRIRLPQSLLEIGEEAFSKCPLLTEISLPANVCRIAESALTNTFDWDRKKPGLQRIECAPENAAFYIEGNGLYERLEDGVKLLKYFGSNCVERLSDNVTEIGACAFRRAKITRLTLPPALREIHDDAFLECALERICMAGADGFEIYVPPHPLTLRNELLSGFYCAGARKNGLYDFAFYGNTIKKQKLGIGKLNMMDCFCRLPTGDGAEKWEWVRGYVTAHFAETIECIAKAEDDALLGNWCKAGVFSAEQLEEAATLCGALKKTALVQILLDSKNSQFGAAEFDFTL